MLYMKKGKYIAILLFVVIAVGCTEFQVVKVNRSDFTDNQEEKYETLGVRIRDGGQISGKLVIINKETGEKVLELEQHGGKTPVATGAQVLTGAANNIGAGALIGSGLRNMNTDTDTNSFSSVQNN